MYCEQMLLLVMGSWENAYCTVEQLGVTVNSSTLQDGGVGYDTTLIGFH